MPFFSIIIPTYNRVDFIVKTIESVQKQLFFDWECIVIDDGSIDDTRNVVNEISSKDKRVSYFYQFNSERSVARNNGIKKSSGQYICFLDSDDFFLENHLSLLYHEIEIKNYPIGMFFTNYILNKKNIQERVYFPKMDKNVLNYLIYNPIIPARVCIHSEILKFELFDEEIVIVEDLLLWIRIALKHQLYHIEKETVVYNIHDNNSINIKNNAAVKRLNGIKVFFKKYPDIRPQIPSVLWHFIIGDTHFNIMKFHLQNKDRKMAMKHLILSLLHQKIHAQFKHKIYILLNILFNRSIPEYTSK